MRRRQDGRTVDYRGFEGYASCDSTLGGAGCLAALGPWSAPGRSYREAATVPRDHRERPTGGASGRMRPEIRTRGVRMEHRQGARYRAFRLVELQYEEFGRRGALLYNVSRNGMFVLTTAAVGVNRCVDVRIPAAGGTVRISALVVHCGNGGLGMIFRDLDDAASAAIEGFCA